MRSGVVRVRARSQGVMRWMVPLAVMTVSSAPLAQAERTGMIVPAYQYPTLGTLWGDCAAAASRVTLVAIMNPANGPGVAVDANYSAASASVRSAGGRVIGYVATFQAGIPLENALSEVDRYRAWYALDGIFLDGMAHDSDPAHLAWYVALRDSIRAREPTWLVVGGPGSNTPPGYLAAADILAIFESDGATYSGWEPDAWVASYPPSRFLHLVHSLPTADGMRQAVDRARSRRAGWVYVTHDVLPNPWDEKPAFWDDMVAALENTQAVAVGAPAAAALRLRVWPNPTVGAVRFELPADAGPCEIEVVDATGRLVARLPSSPLPQWDGRDRDGALAATGVYFARVRGSTTKSVRIAVVR